jgi:hypothetical protein
VVRQVASRDAIPKRIKMNAQCETLWRIQHRLHAGIDCPDMTPYYTHTYLRYTLIMPPYYTLPITYFLYAFSFSVYVPVTSNLFADSGFGLLLHHRFFADSGFGLLLHHRFLANITIITNIPTIIKVSLLPNQASRSYAIRIGQVSVSVGDPLVRNPDRAGLGLGHRLERSRFLALDF